MNISEFLISEDATVLYTMERLDNVAKKVLFVTSGNTLLATVTDGDIRRWILKKGDLNAKIKEIANYSPKKVLISEKRKAKSIMKKYMIEAMPVVDDKNNIVSIMFWNNEEVGDKASFKLPVVVMAGGLGTRLYPYTKILPKPLIPIGEIPIAEHIINRFVSNGASEFFLIVNHKKNMIKAYFNEIMKKYSVEYIDEDVPLGTGGGLSLLKGKINETFVLTNCDILIDEDYEKIYRHHKDSKNVITMVCSLKNIKIPYGVVDIGEDGDIENMREKPEISIFTNTGMYIVESKVIDELEENIAIGFPDIINSYKLKGEKVGVYPISENSWLDMGQIEELEEMRKRLENE